MRGLPGRWRGVSGILAGLMLFAMLFSVGIGFYVYVNQANNSVNQANANKQSVIQQSSLENLTLTAAANAGTITVTAANRGGVATTLLSVFVDNSNGVLQNSPVSVPNQPTLNVGQSDSFVVPGYAYPTGTSITVSVITGRGNTFTAQYPPPQTGTQTDVVVNSQTTTVIATVSGGGSNALVVVMTATPPITFNCANECVTDNITVYNYALSSVTGVALSPDPPSVVVCGAGNTPGCTATLTSPVCSGPTLSNGQPDTGDSIAAYSGTGNAPYVIFQCTYDANTGAVGGFASFSGEATGVLAVTGQQVASAIATSNTIEIGGQANVITQGAFTANFLFYKYSACQTPPQSTGTHGGYPTYAYTGVTTGAYPCNPTPSQITNPGTMNDGLLDDAFLLYSAASNYVAYYVSLTNDYNQTLPILQYSYLYMDPGISGEQYYFLAGAATDYYHAATNSYSSYYPNYNVANSVPTLDAYSATTTSCAESYNPMYQNYSVPSPSTCINIHPGQTLTLTFAACGWDASTWDWGGTAYANEFDSPATNCNINSVPGYRGNVPEGQVVSIEVTYMYKNQAYSQLLPFDGQFILNQYTPSVSTLLSSSTIQAGQSVTDAATLSSASPYAGGTVQYEYFSSSTCSGSATNVGSTVTVTDGVIPNSPAQTFSTAGSYGWEAVYSGDTQDVAATSPCEPLTVTQATPTIATTLSASTITAGTSAYDTATLSSDSGSNTGGSVTYSYYSGSSCTGSPTTVSTVTVSGGVIPNSAPEKFSTAGSYSWQAVYSGDSNNNGATSSCEPLTVNPPLVAPVIAVSPAAIDSGQSATLSTTTALSGGTSPYTCQWLAEAPGAGSYSDLGSSFTSGCTTSGLPTISTGALTTTGTWQFELQVSDSGGATATSNAVTVTLNAALAAGSITPSAPVIDSGQSISLSASWSGGTSTYKVTWYSGTSSTCSSDTTVVATHSGVSASPDSLSVSPGATTYYCAVVTDSASPTESVTDAAVKVTVDSAPAAGAITPPSPIIDSGQSIALSSAASGGTGTYSYQWYTATSSGTCTTSDTAISGATSSTYAVPSTTAVGTYYYCYIVTDTGVTSGATPAATAASATDKVTIDSALTAGAVTPSSPTIDNGQTITLTSHASGGTGTYSYQWYTATSSGTCTTSDTAISGATSSTYAVPSTTAVGTYYYCYIVTDTGVTSGATPAATAGSTTDTVTVDAALSAGAITPSSPTIDYGQTITLTANPSGGTGTYSYQWYTATSSGTCTTSDTAISGATSSTYAVPSTTAVGTYYYCYIVTDTGVSSGSSPTPVADSATDTLTVKSALTAGAITPSSPTTDSGNSITLTANPSGGTGTYSYQWYTATSSGTCTTSDTVISGATSSTYAVPTTTASGTYYYCYIVTDTGVTSGATPTATASSATDKVTVNTALSISANATPSTIDSGQSSILTATASGGSLTYSTYSFYSGSTCSGTALQSGSSNTYATSPTSTTTYCVKVTDSLGYTATTTVSVTVNPALTAGTITPSAPVIDKGQSITLSASWTGGTTTFTVKWYSGSSATCSSDTTAVATHTGDSASPDTESVSPTSTTYYCAVITDSSTGTPAQSATDAAVKVTVDSVPAAGAITPSPVTIEQGHSATLTSAASGGTGTYSYQWYTATSSGTCTTSDTAVSGATSSTYAVPTTTASGVYYYCYIVTDTGVTSGATPAATASSATDTVYIPSLSLSKTSGTPSTSTTLSGSYYVPSTSYSYCLSTSSTAVSCVSGTSSTFTSSSSGAIPTGKSVTIPSGTANGTYYVIVYSGTTVVASATFTVT